MSSDIDKEIEAIKIVLDTLQPLGPEVRESVIEYVLKRLGMTLHPSGEKPTPPLSPATQTSPSNTKQVHLEDFKKEKQPKSAIEMAVLIAYYLSHLVEESDRKSTITTKDLDTYFKIANFKLPTRQDFTLPNAKNAGYLDSAGLGEYKLNPVGYNLVVHSMPRSSKTSTNSTRKPKNTRKKKKIDPKKRTSVRKKKTK